MTTQIELADDVIWGAKNIARFLGITPRQIYHMAEQQYLPIFRVGSTLACRRSTLMAYIRDREEQNASYRRGLPRL